MDGQNTAPPKRHPGKNRSVFFFFNVICQHMASFCALIFQEPRHPVGCFPFVGGGSLENLPTKFGGTHLNSKVAYGRYPGFKLPLQLVVWTGGLVIKEGLHKDVEIQIQTTNQQTPPLKTPSLYPSPPPSCVDQEKV